MQPSTSVFSTLVQSSQNLMTSSPLDQYQWTWNVRSNLLYDSCNLVVVTCPETMKENYVLQTENASGHADSVLLLLSFRAIHVSIKGSNRLMVPAVTYLGSLFELVSSSPNLTDQWHYTWSQVKQRCARQTEFLSTLFPLSWAQLNRQLLLGSLTESARKTLSVMGSTRWVPGPLQHKEGQ